MRQRLNDNRINRRQPSVGLSAPLVCPHRRGAKQKRRRGDVSKIECQLGSSLPWPAATFDHSSGHSNGARNPMARPILLNKAQIECSIDANIDLGGARGGDSLPGGNDRKKKTTSHPIRRRPSIGGDYDTRRRAHVNHRSTAIGRSLPGFPHGRIDKCNQQQ
uniref:Uncharacterized protein n=1 Tax=Plectus sambesii TaxID=2011161 RepID=A0A914WKB2_9BILA